MSTWQGGGRLLGSRRRADAGKLESLPLSRARSCCPNAQTRLAQERKGRVPRREETNERTRVGWSTPRTLLPGRVSETAEESYCSFSPRESVAF